MTTYRDPNYFTYVMEYRATLSDGKATSNSSHPAEQYSKKSASNLSHKNQFRLLICIKKEAGQTSAIQPRGVEATVQSGPVCTHLAANFHHKSIMRSSSS